MPLKITLITLFFALTLAIAPKALALTATGTIESVIKDSGIGVNWQVMTWTASTSASSTITLKARTATTSDMSTALPWGSCAAVSNGTDISGNNCVTDGQRYIQYYAFLSVDYETGTDFVSPEILDVNVNYDAVGALDSSVFDSLAGDTVLSAVRWGETKPGSSDVLIQLRSSADGLSWTAWQGPSGTSADFFTDPGGGEALSPGLRDGAGERFFQYRIWLSSDGMDLPVLSDFTLDYQAVVPAITSVSPSFAGSNASGTLAMAVSGSNFTAGDSVAIESGGSSFAISGAVIAANSISFNLDTSLLFGGSVRIVVTNQNGAPSVWENFYINEYVGTYESKARELPNLSFGVLSWTASTTASSSVSLKIRTSANSGMSGATAWETCPGASNGADISALSGVVDGARYVQYRAELRRTYGSGSVASLDDALPELLDVSLEYARIAASGTLVSSPFDSGTDTNAWRKLTWTETAPIGTDVSFRLRTAPDAAGMPGAWSEWKGPFDTAGYYKNADGAGGIFIGHNDGVSDRWVQYAVFLESAGDLVPLLSDLNLEYGDKAYSTEIFKNNTIFKNGASFR